MTGRGVLVLALLGAACSGAPSPAGDPAPETSAPPSAAVASPDPGAAPPAVPRLVALGTAQDGGLPHAACGCLRCAAARREPGLARRVASLGLVLPGGERYLVDATPDIRPQLDALATAAGRPPGAGVDRAPLQGVFLTHAHMGHYTGLAFLGYEAIHAQGVAVHATPAMAAFLRGNGPWGQLVELGNIELQILSPGTAVRLAAGVEVAALPVPHRDEYSDTVGFLIRGPAERVLYVPDTDSWEAWDPTLPEVLQREGVTVALLDATFFDAHELPGRDPASIGHPLVRATMELLQPLVAGGRLRVLLTHMNPSNPLLEPDSPARLEVERRGFEVLADGQEIPL